MICPSLISNSPVESLKLILCKAAREIRILVPNPIINPKIKTNEKITILLFFERTFLIFIHFIIKFINYYLNFSNYSYLIPNVEGLI